MLDSWELASVLAKFLLYLGVLGSTGLVLVRIVFGRATDRLWSPLSRQASVLALLALLAAGLGFVLQGAALTGDASGMTSREILGLLWQTPVGIRLVLLVAGLALVLGGLMSLRTGIWIAAGGGVLALWSFSRLGHIADKDSFWLAAPRNLPGVACRRCHPSRHGRVDRRTRTAVERRVMNRRDFLADFAATAPAPAAGRAPYPSTTGQSSSVSL